jgi:hypothetical protein
MNNRRRKRNSIIFVIAISLLVCLLLFLIIGNLLAENAQGEPSNTDSVTTPTQPRDPRTIKAEYLNISSTLGDISTTLRTLAESRGAAAVSMKVKGTDGALLYNSPIAQKLGYQSSKSLPKMSDIVSRATQRNMYTSAYITTDALKTEKSAARMVELSYEAALASELSENGVGDVIISPLGLTAENYADMLYFADSVRQVNKTAVIGIAVTAELLSSPDAAAIVDALYSKFDFLALDLTGCDKDGILSAFGEDSKLYYVLRYTMRVILPVSADAEDGKQISELIASKNLSSYQYIG